MTLMPPLMTLFTVQQECPAGQEREGQGGRLRTLGSGHGLGAQGGEDYNGNYVERARIH